jgi:uncharacterized membrane protein YhfC
MIGLPIALTLIIVRRFKVSWWVILTGVLTYLVSQAIHYPLLKQIMSFFQTGKLPLPPNQYVPIVLALVMGFLAALCEESIKYLGFWIIRKKTPNVESSVGLGIAHGGMESIGLAVWPFFPIYGGTLIQFLTIVFYNPGAELAKGVSSATVQSYLTQIAQIWANPWHIGLLFGVERIITIVTQILLAVLVWKAVKSHNFLWFVLAFFYHMLIDGVSVFLNYSGWGFWAIDGVMAVFMLANLYLIYYFWKDEKEKETEGYYDEDDEDEDEEDNKEVNDKEPAEKEA